MKKLLIVCLIALSPIAAKASGKVAYEIATDDQGKSYSNMLGLNAYQKLNSRMGVNTWAGMGNQSRDVSEDVKWALVKSQLDVYLGSWTLGGGLEYKYVLPYQEHSLAGFLRVEKKLW